MNNDTIGKLLPVMSFFVAFGATVLTDDGLFRLVRLQRCSVCFGWCFFLSGHFCRKKVRFGIITRAWSFVYLMFFSFSLECMILFSALIFKCCSASGTLLIGLKK